MKKFEYKTDDANNSLIGYPEEEDYLNAEGADGWELVAVIEDDKETEVFYYWKREIKETA